MKAWGMLLLAALLVPLNCFISGFVIAKHWEWFLVELGVRPVGYLQAVGISSLVRLMTWTIPKKNKHDEERKWLEAEAGYLLVMGFALLTGFALHTLRNI